METVSHVLRLVEAFRAFDSDNDGQITAAELGGLMGSTGCYNPSEQDVKAMMQRGDTNKDGLLSMEEFLEMQTKDLELGNLENSLRIAFENMGDEDIEILTGDELFELTNGLSLDDCQALIASMDEDGDGAVSFEDFKLIVGALL